MTEVEHTLTSLAQHKSALDILVRVTEQDMVDIDHDHRARSLFYEMYCILRCCRAQVELLQADIEEEIVLIANVEHDME